MDGWDEQNEKRKWKQHFYFFGFFKVKIIKSSSCSQSDTESTTETSSTSMANKTEIKKSLAAQRKEIVADKVSLDFKFPF